MAGYCTFVFDDGNSVHYTAALPLFQTQGVVAVAAVNASTVGTSGKLTWGQVRELYEAGWEIANHGYAHQDLTLISEDAAYEEVMLGKRLIEIHGLPHGIECESFVWPFHAVNSATRRIVRRAHKVGRGLDGSEPLNILDIHVLRGTAIDNPASLAAYQALIVTAQANNSWIIFYMHGVDSQDQATLNTLIDDCQAQGVSIVTMIQGYRVTKHRLPGEQRVSDNPYQGISLVDGAGATNIVASWPGPTRSMEIWEVSIHRTLITYVITLWFITSNEAAITATALNIRTSAGLATSVVDLGGNAFSIRGTVTTGDALTYLGQARQLFYLANTQGGL